MRRIAAIAVTTLLAACSSGEPGSAQHEEGAPDAAKGVADASASSGADAGHGHDGAATDATTSVDASNDGDAGSSSDATASDAADAGPECAPFGAPGQCVTTTACAALGDHSSYPGYCPGPADIECCIDTPDVSVNPPTPAGYQLMQQSQVTTAMTNWAVMILNDPVTYPMFSTTLQQFGALTVLARVEWHPPDFQNSIVHRGVTLYVPIDGG